MKTIQRKNAHVSAIALLKEVKPEQIRSLVRSYGVSDVLLDDAPRGRVQRALRDAVDSLLHECEGGSYYRGFFGYVGSVPALWERKILSQANIGLILNRSLRLAIDYWSMNPDSQMVGVCLNENETFTSRQSDNIGAWINLGVRPWEIGMFEAQRHYLEYWEEPIRNDLMPSAIPTLLRNENNELSVIDLETQKSVLVKMQDLSSNGKINEAIQSTGVTLRARQNRRQ